MSDARYPDFDKNGKYLYFTASTNLGPAISFAEMSTFSHQSSRSVYAVVLRKDLPSPLAPESDEEKVAEEPKPTDARARRHAGPDPAETPKPEEPKPGEKMPGAEQTEAAAAAAKAPAKKAPEPVRIDLEGIDQRIVALCRSRRATTSASIAGKANSFFVLEVRPPARPAPAGPPGFVVHKFDLEKRKFDKILDGVGGFEVSANGEKMLFRQGPNWVIAATAAPVRPGEGVLKTAEMEVYVDPQAEWRQMYRRGLARRARLLLRPGPARRRPRKRSRKRYEPYLDSRRPTAADLNYLFREMLNQLTVGHMFIAGGDQPAPELRPRRVCSARITRSRTAATASPRSTTARTGTRSCARRSRSPASTSRPASICWRSNGRDVRADRQRLHASSRARPASRS